MTAPLQVMDRRPLSTRGRIVLVASVLLGALVLVVVARRPASEDRTLDPAGTGRTGVKALVLLLREGGSDVRVSARPPDATRATAVLLQDTLDPQRTEAVQDWVAGGGTLVVTDPRSSLTRLVPHLSPINGATGVTDLRDRCAGLPAVAGVDAIDANGAYTFERRPRPEGSVGCYPEAGADFLVASPFGRGTIVALGGAGLWVNANLATAGNAGLAVALLAPRPPAAVQVISDLAPDAGAIGVAAPRARSLLDALPDGFSVAVVEAFLAFLAAVAWRSRRLGRPVREVQPVALPGSELVVAVGRLNQRGGHRAAAAATVVDRARRRTADRLGIPRSVPPDDLGRIVAERTGVDASTVAAGLTPTPPPDDAGLVRTAAAAAAIEQSVLDPTRRPGDRT